MVLYVRTCNIRVYPYQAHLTPENQFHIQILLRLASLYTVQKTRVIVAMMSQMTSGSGMFK